jgi:hypothetical protein
MHYFRSNEKRSVGNEYAQCSSTQLKCRCLRKEVVNHAGDGHQSPVTKGFRRRYLRIFEIYCQADGSIGPVLFEMSEYFDQAPTILAALKSTLTNKAGIRQRGWYVGQGPIADVTMQCRNGRKKRQTCRRWQRLIICDCDNNAHRGFLWASKLISAPEKLSLLVEVTQQVLLRADCMRLMCAYRTELPHLRSALGKAARQTYSA